MAQIHVSVGAIPPGDDAGQDAPADAGKGKGRVGPGIPKSLMERGERFVAVGWVAMGASFRFGIRAEGNDLSRGHGKPPVSSLSLRKIAASLPLGSRMAGDHLLDPCPHLPARSLEAEPMLALRF